MTLVASWLVVGRGSPRETARGGTRAGRARHTFTASLATNFVTDGTHVALERAFEPAGDKDVRRGAWARFSSICVQDCSTRCTS